MIKLSDQFRSAHRFLAQHSFYPLVLCSVLACGILAARIYLSQSLIYVFLVWNLFLAWAPYYWSLWAVSIQRRRPAHWWWPIVPGALWLLFFPNAPYIVTDFIHLRALAPIPLWFDIGLIAIFAWSGCFLAVASLRIMQTLVANYLGGAVSWLFVATTLGLNGLGIYLGRFLRWNSWDVFVNPHGVLSDTVEIVAHPFRNMQATGVIGLFGTLLLVCYMTFCFGCRSSGEGLWGGPKALPKALPLSDGFLKE